MCKYELTRYSEDVKVEIKSKLTIYIYIYGKMEVNLIVCKWANMNWQSILWMILFIVEIKSKLNIIHEKHYIFKCSDDDLM